MTLLPILALGFFLGMRHATDADHVVAVSTIVSRERSLRAAARVGVLWGIGHTLTILVVGGAIILFGVVIPPRLGLGMEFSVAIMLVFLGALNLRATFRSAVAPAHGHGEDDHEHSHEPQARRSLRSLRPLFIGIVHGLAGSAAIALLVLGAIRNATWALGYLAVFGVGTIAGMLLITLAMATPLAVTARRFDRMHVLLAVGTGLASVMFGAVLMYNIAFVGGLFGSSPLWIPG